MLFSVSIFALIAVFFESKYFCASSTPADGSEAASTRLTSSSVNESNSLSNVLISASFLQPVISRQARAISTARTLVRIRGSLHKLILKRYHVTDGAPQSQERRLAMNCVWYLLHQVGHGEAGFCPV